MRLDAGQIASTFDYAAVGQVLDLIEGDRVRLSWALLDPERPAVLGGAAGKLRVGAPSDYPDIPGSHLLPAVGVEAGDLGYLLEVGDACLLVSARSLTGAIYVDGVLHVNAGPLMLRLEREGD
jgi:hypothetical protein